MFRKILLILVLVSSLIGDENLTNDIGNHKFLERIDILPLKKYIYSVCLDGYLYYVYPSKNLVQATGLYSGGSQPIKCDNKD